jgi:hypothetical protein
VKMSGEQKPFFESSQSRGASSERKRSNERTTVGCLARKHAKVRPHFELALGRGCDRIAHGTSTVPALKVPPDRGPVQVPVQLQPECDKIIVGSQLALKVISAGAHFRFAVPVSSWVDENEPFSVYVALSMSKLALSI